jgi:molybdopterin-containing oxidoreductase family iron-sulfur binding subunit
MNEDQIKQWKSLDERNQPLDHTLLAQGEAGNTNLFKSDFLSRREFMEWTGSMVALLSTVGCTRQPEQHLIPYSKAPEEVIPGKPLYFASAMVHEGYGNGVLVESNMGRPTKVDGNPDHPGSLGSSDLWAQASILSLYDPDRQKVVIGNGNVAMWGSYVAKLESVLKAHAAKNGAGLRILTETITSPTLAAQFAEFQRRYPSAAWHQYQPVSRDNEYEGARLAFGTAVETLYHFDQATVVLSLDSDFFTADPGPLHEGFHWRPACRR